MTTPDQPEDRTSDSKNRFWRQKTLDEMTNEEWESLCDGCGKCCLIKLIDEDTEEMHHTRVACELLDIGSCRCSDYENRHAKVPDCVQLRAGSILDIPWLPDTCAYRLVAEGKDLAWWHPLVSGDPETVHQAGISVRGWVISEKKVDDDYERFILKEAP
ncbi:MAG: YcgN family cysteine cluster protein [Hyphomicrobiaceae bacterium]